MNKKSISIARISILIGIISILLVSNSCKKAVDINSNWVGMWIGHNDGYTYSLNIEEDDYAEHTYWATNGGTSYVVMTGYASDGSNKHEGKARINGKRMYIGRASYKINQEPQNGVANEPASIILDGITYYKK